MSDQVGNPEDRFFCFAAHERCIDQNVISNTGSSTNGATDCRKRFKLLVNMVQMLPLVDLQIILG